MKTLKVEAVYLAAYETFEDVTADLPRFMGSRNTQLEIACRAWFPGANQGRRVSPILPKFAASGQDGPTDAVNVQF
jgi:hypothetical protein